ncbi:hypothetical protein [Sulfuritalea sp.]|jgi:hypothetical protein|uniref:hypothetical protein n=1 Tax=Sulfuritalea sp. TaxID=2480090 RepID=UPI001ACE9D04|nr:hypothetical protein [Sulfuritalea sp.]MBN8473897.1 hypothetical protein [Sulfuritalea sp.]
MTAIQWLVAFAGSTVNLDQLLVHRHRNRRLGDVAVRLFGIPLVLGAVMDPLAKFLFLGSLSKYDNRHITAHSHINSGDGDDFAVLALGS